MIFTPILNSYNPMCQACVLCVLCFPSSHAINYQFPALCLQLISPQPCVTHYLVCAFIPSLYKSSVLPVSLSSLNVISVCSMYPAISVIAVFPNKVSCKKFLVSSFCVPGSPVYPVCTVTQWEVRFLRFFLNKGLNGLQCRLIFFFDHIYHGCRYVWPWLYIYIYKSHDNRVIILNNFKLPFFPA